MPVAYPSSLPLALFDKTREQPAAFQMAQPRRGWGYVEPTGTDTPVFWSLTWRFTAAQAQTFWQWFVFTTERGTAPFTMSVRTEFGLIAHEMRFVPDGLLPARQLGTDVWEYKATVMARALQGVTEPTGYAYFSAVVLQLHGDGPNGSTTFTDSSSYARTPSVVSGSTISTAQSKFGGASIATGARVQYDTAPEFDMGTAPFCFEAWVRFTTVGALNFIAGQADTTGTNASVSIVLMRTAGNKIEAAAYNGSTAIVDIVGTTTIAINTWYHVAFARSGSTFYLWLDGASEGTQTSALAVNASVYDFSIGCLGEASTAPMTGFIDDVRWTVGANPYTVPFTPPAAAHPDNGL